MPYVEVLRLREWWKGKEKIEKVLVMNYTATTREVSLLPVAEPKRDKVQWLIEDLNSIGKEHLEEFENLALDPLGPFGDEVLDFIVAANGRKDTQIQDYKVAQYKIYAILGAMMGMGKNVVLTAHLQGEKDEITGRGRMTPLVWGKGLPSAIPRLFGECFQAIAVSDGKGGVGYKWLTKPDPGGFIGFLGSRKFDNLPKLVDQDFGYLSKLDHK